MTAPSTRGCILETRIGATWREHSRHRIAFDAFDAMAELARLYLSRAIDEYRLRDVETAVVIQSGGAPVHQDMHTIDQPERPEPPSALNHDDRL